MNKRMKKDWLRALRSGRYKQTQSVLCNEMGEMCCLGVLYDVAVDGEWIRLTEPGPKGWAILSHDGRELLDGSRVRYVDLPDKILRQAKLSRDEEGTLISMNDSMGKSFAQIADYIEANL